MGTDHIGQSPRAARRSTGAAPVCVVAFVEAHERVDVEAVVVGVALAPRR
jgi:hypothetical protein